MSYNTHIAYAWMKYTGEGQGLPTESNSQVLERAGPYMDTSLESPNRAPKVQGIHSIPISQAKGQRIAAYFLFHAIFGLIFRVAGGRSFCVTI